MGISMKHGNNKNEPDTTSIGSGPVPNVETEESWALLFKASLA